MTELQKVEKALLIGQWDDSIEASTSPAYKLAKDTVNGSFRDVLKSQEVTNLLKIILPKEELLQNPLKSWFSFDQILVEDNQEQELLRIVAAVACLHAFIQVNWTGPDLDITPADVFLKPLTISPDEFSEEALNQKAVSELAYGGEPAYHLARYTTFLRASQLLLEGKFVHCHSIPWWRLRATRVHQSILDQAVSPPADVITALAPLYQGIAEEGDLAGCLALEHGLLEHTLGQDRQAAELFVIAARHTGLEYELTGSLGKRTKFQQTELSQLVLLAQSRERPGEDVEGQAAKALTSTGDEGRSGSSDKNGSTEENRSKDSPAVPETLALNDDTLLEQTQFTASSGQGTHEKLAHLDPSSQPALHPLDQCILLSLCLNVKNSSPAHGLTAEQMKPYVDRVITHPKNWSVHTVALLIRSRLEATRSRTVERSTLQLQALVDQMPTADSHVTERLRFVHSLPLPSKWEMERELAMRMLSLGVVRSALEIFERLEMWEEAVKCWHALEKPEAGIAVVRDLLEGRKEEADAVILRGKVSTQQRRHVIDTAREAKLWCLLGDLEPSNALNHYQRAWEISEQKSGRAMRSMGGYCFSKGDFPQAIDCLKKAVAINPILSRPWFLLGCACVREERWEEARDAFARCVSIDNEDAESWNNLASVYLHMNSSDRTEDNGESGSSIRSSDKDNSAGPIPFDNKMLAFHALKIGLKHSYDNWRMWMNYMIVAMDVGEFAEAAHAQARVVEERADKIGTAAVDEDVVDRLVDAVTRSSDSNEVRSSSSGAGVEAAAAANSTLSADNTNSGVADGSNPNVGASLRPRVYDLFERTLLPRVGSERVYRAYARLLGSEGRWSEALKYHLDAYRLSVAATLEKGESDKSKFIQALSEVEEIIDVLRNFGPRAEEEGGKEPATHEAEAGALPIARVGKWRMQARSILRNFAARTRDAFEDSTEWEKIEQMQDELKNE